MEAAAAAAADIIRKREEVLVALRLDLEAAQYVAEHARRQYDSMDPENRLVAAQLERRWNDALVRVEDLERRIDEQDSHLEVETLSFELMNLADDLPRVWNDPQTDIRLKKRIVRTLIEEVIVDLDSEESAIKAVIHWNGGVHTELSVQRRKRGQHGQATSKDTIDAVRVLSRVCSDRFIAQLLSRNGLRTGKNNPWSRRAVKGVRHSYDIPVHTKEGQAEQGWMTLSQAAAHVGVAPRTLRLAVERGAVEALHPLPDGPWVLNRKDLELPEVKERFAKIRTRSSEKPNFDDGNLMIPGVS
jgi:hypothetical protein